MNRSLALLQAYRVEQLPPASKSDAGIQLMVGVDVLNSGLQVCGVFRVVVDPTQAIAARRSDEEDRVVMHLQDSRTGLPHYRCCCRGPVRLGYPCVHVFAVLSSLGLQSMDLFLPHLV